MSVEGERANDRDCSKRTQPTKEIKKTCMLQIKIVNNITLDCGLHTEAQYRNSVLLLTVCGGHLGLQSR